MGNEFCRFKGTTPNKFRTINYFNIIVLIPIFIVTLLLSACGKPDKKSMLSEHYEVIDSGLISGGDSINWMDNNRIILRAVDPKKPSKGKIYIWDINTNEIIEYSEGGMPCYYNGYIHYAYKTDLKLTEKKPYGSNWKEGIFNKEKLFTKIYSESEGRKWHKENVRNQFSCRLNKRPKEMANHVWVPLLEEHGYLDFGLQGKGINTPSPIHMITKKNKYKLKFKKNQIGLTSGQYYPYKQSYFFWPHVPTSEQRKIWKESECIEGWWLNPKNGKSYSECIPYTPWKRSHLVIPTIKGFFLVNYNYSGNDPKKSGGYLYINNIFKPVIKGLIRQVKTSPDGCKIALTHKLGNYTNLKVKMTLKVINICTEKEQSNDQ